MHAWWEGHRTDARPLFDDELAAPDVGMPRGARIQKERAAAAELIQRALVTLVESSARDARTKRRRPYPPRSGLLG